jgi:hypothetical protein
MAAGVRLVENLANFTDAYGTNKNFKKRDKVTKLNPWADAGSLSRDKYFDPDPKSGSAQWKGLLADTNPDVRDNDFYRSARSFITPDEKGFKPADDAYKRWEGFAFNDFVPGNKNGPLADRIDTEDVQTFYDTYYASRLVDDETFVGSSNLRYMFEEPAAVASTESNPNEANISPSQGVDV